MCSRSSLGNKAGRSSSPSRFVNGAWFSVVGVHEFVQSGNNALCEYGHARSGRLDTTPLWTYPQLAARKLQVLRRPASRLLQSLPVLWHSSPGITISLFVRVPMNRPHLQTGINVLRPSVGGSRGKENRGDGPGSNLGKIDRRSRSKLSTR